MHQEFTRRTFFRKAGSTSISLVGAAAALKACMAPQAALAAQTQVESLFWQWREVDQRYSGSNHIPEMFAEYQRLQDLVTKAEPQTARDVAMQLFCTTDCGASDMPEEFFERLRTLALEGRA
ncbi:hypothetical protein [Antarcticirhabdus aurantiaca]|uniref:Uncharacterized protein n=1 Tax=Antarcticirhabdus aurantiaca TaxID=2606717 RepID=A0ACD4NQ50_9HYPH|nr:hypothetical protein [Antarcticirhabdus aurantiaca]WAJ28919.1 hypothetical protein OXU80_01300 [Jeongeuplla avenae]